MAVDPRRNPTPHNRVLDAGAPKDLRHLRHVSEHVGEVADGHRVAQLRRPPPPVLQVAHDRLAGDAELVEQRLPRADREPPLGDGGSQPRFGVGSDLQVVVDGGELTVQREGEVGLGVDEVQHVVDEVDQPRTQALKRQVPLAVPVGVRHHPDRRGVGHEDVLAVRGGTDRGR